MSISYSKSNLSGKKYRAEIPKAMWNKARTDKITTPFKVIHFGALGYQHYHDRIGLFSELDHNDSKRRANYRARHSGVMSKYGPAYKVKYSPAWFSFYYLW